jgi:hypothetical protein
VGKVGAVFFLQAQPIIVHIEPPPSENAGAIKDLTRVIVGSLGLTGAFALVALVVGLAIGGVLFWVRSRP